MAYDAKSLRITKIHWIGVFLSDVDKFSLPKHCLLPLNKEGEIDYSCLKITMVLMVFFSIFVLKMNSIGCIKCFFDYRCFRRRSRN